MAHGAATIAGAAAAGAGTMETVIEGKFLAASNLFVTVEENFAAQLTGGEVGIATLIDKLGSAAAVGRIDDPVAIQVYRVMADIFS